MPYSRKAKYYHIRRHDPRSFWKNSFRVVPITHTKYKGKYRKVPGCKVIIGKNKFTGESQIQSILIPK